MFFNSQITTFTVSNEHVLEHDLLVKKNFSNPKIYTANGDLKKRWYVYFSFRNPETGKLQRMKNIYGTANTYKTKEERLAVLIAYRKSLLKYLKQGFDPFKDNTALFHQEKGKESKPISEKVESAKPEVNEESKMDLKEAFDFGLKIKEKLLSPTTKRAYDNRIKNFLKWMQENKLEIETIDQLTKKEVIDFLNEVLSKTSPRNRNNFRVDLSSIMQALEDNDIIPINFVKKINVLKTTPERNKTYTTEKQEEIFAYLDEKDPVLMLYIKFISYNFLRPIEVCRLKVGDIDLKNKTIQFKAKNSPLKTKIIPEILLDELPDLTKLDKDQLLFTPNKLGGVWEATTGNRRDYFTKRFKKVVKDHFNLSGDYGLYSFRHTYITRLYRQMVKDSSPFEAKSRLMLITGHSSMTALQKYLRDIDAELPADYSEMLR